MKKSSLYDELTLLQALEKGNADAFAIIYDRFYPSVFYYIKRRVIDPDRANDITAECFIKFWKSGKKDFDSLGGVQAYLLKAAANSQLNESRDLKSEQNRQKEFQYHLTQLSAGDTPEEEDEYKAELMRLVMEEIEKLPRKRRQIFTMAYMDGMKNEEIATRLRLTNKTVRNQKNRALIQLRLAVMQKKMGFITIAYLLHIISLLRK